MSTEQESETPARPDIIVYVHAVALDASFRIPDKHLAELLEFLRTRTL